MQNKKETRLTWAWHIFYLAVINILVHILLMQAATINHMRTILRLIAGSLQ